MSHFRMYPGALIKSWVWFLTYYAMLEPVRKSAAASSTNSGTCVAYAYSMMAALPEATEKVF